MISFSYRMVLRAPRLHSPPVCCLLMKQTHASDSFVAIQPIQKRFTTDGIEPIDTVKGDAKKKRVKTPEKPKITLLYPNDNITVTTIDEAEKVAASKRLRLVRMHDSELRTQRPVYKLLSEAQFLNEELQVKKLIREEKIDKKKSFIKGEKLMVITVRITDHDLEVKINKTLKWIAKTFEVRMVLSGSADNTAPQEAIYKKIEKNVQGIGRIVQKRFNGGDLKFQIIPLKRDNTSAKKSNVDEKESDVDEENTQKIDSATVV